MISTQASDYITKDFFQLVGLESLSDEDKQDLLERMNKTVLARVYAHIYKDLTAAEQQELDTISSENIIPFLNDRGYDVAALILEEALRYRMEVAQMLEIATAPLSTSSHA